MLDQGSDKRDIDFRFVRPPDQEYVYTAHVLHATDRVLVLEQTVTPSKPLVIDGIEVLGPGYRAVWFLFQDEPYDVARCYRPNGEWTGYYVDVLEPVHWSGSDPQTLEPIVDLFLDLWVSPDGRYWVLDADEFENAVRNGALAPHQQDHARATLDSCIDATTRGVFPPAVVREFS